MKPCVFLSSKLILEQLELLLPSKSLVVDVVVFFCFFLTILLIKEFLGLLR